MRDSFERGQPPRKAGRFGVRQLGLGIVCAQGADCRRQTRTSRYHRRLRGGRRWNAVPTRRTLRNAVVVGGRLKRAKMAALHTVATERDPPVGAAADGTAALPWGAAVGTAFHRRPNSRRGPPGAARRDASPYRTAVERRPYQADFAKCGGGRRMVEAPPRWRRSIRSRRSATLPGGGRRWCEGFSFWKNYANRKPGVRIAWNYGIISGVQDKGVEYDHTTCSIC